MRAIILIKIKKSKNVCKYYLGNQYSLKNKMLLKRKKHSLL